MTRSNLSIKLFWLCIFIGIFYQSYRYPFQINYSGTSPTYSDTPEFLQVGKYVILILAAVISLALAKRIQITKSSLIFVYLYLFVSTFPLLHFIADSDSRHLLFPLVSLISLSIVISVNRITIESIDRFIRWLLLISLLVNGIQILLYISFGRLPALAYEGTMFIRFGSFLDDPNGFSAFLFLFLGYIFFDRNNGKNIYYWLAILASILATQSLTAVGVLLMFFAAWMCYITINKPIVSFSIIFIAALIAVSLYQAGGFAVDVFVDFIASKQASIEGHSSWIRLDNLSNPLVFLFGRLQYSPSESWWIGSLNNYGLIWLSITLIVHCGVISKTIYYLRSNGRNDPVCRRVFGALLIFQLFTLIASLNLPYFTVFPINYFALIMLWILTTKRFINRAFL